MKRINLMYQNIAKNDGLHIFLCYIFNVLLF